MDELFNLKSLITITISSLLTIKALSINLNISRDINVNGNGNIVYINQALASTQKGFRLLWQVLITIITLTYPMLGEQYNLILNTLAYISWILVTISFYVIIRAYGWGRWSDFFYFIGVIAISNLALKSNSFLIDAASNAKAIYSTIGYFLEYGFHYGSFGATFTQLLAPFVFKFPPIIGFSMMFLSLWYFLFAHLTTRSADDAIRFFIMNTIMGIIGFFLACNGFLAIIYHDFSYIKRLFLLAILI